MTSIMISIQPQWVEKILNGEKTIEIRKTIPKCKLPCKVYIYCTKGKSDKDSLVVSHSLPAIMPYNANGKVVAEFTLNKVEFIKMPANLPHTLLDKSCLNGSEIMEYLGGEFYKDFYAWHIDNLKIYDKPKELCKFGTLCMGEDCNKCRKCKYYSVDHSEDGIYEVCHCNNVKPMERPPQSWCYVEEL